MKNLQRKEQYRISLLPPIIGVCVKDVHCFSNVLVSSRYLRIDLSSVFLCLCLYCFTAWCPCKYGMILNASALFGIAVVSTGLWTDLNCVIMLIINELPALRFCADLKPLQLNCVGDINTQGAKLTRVICDGLLFSHFMYELQLYLTSNC